MGKQLVLFDWFLFFIFLFLADFHCHALFLFLFLRRLRAGESWVGNLSFFLYSVWTWSFCT
jgi:hypothetical protein